MNTKIHTEKEVNLDDSQNQLLDGSKLKNHEEISEDLASASKSATMEKTLDQK